MMGLIKRYKEWSAKSEEIRKSLFEIRTRNMSVTELQEYRELLKNMNKNNSNAFLIVITMIVAMALATMILDEYVFTDRTLDLTMGYVFGYGLATLCFGISVTKDRNVREVTELIEKRLMEDTE